MASDRKKHRDNVPGARDLRARQTPPEVVLWEALRNRRLDGLKCRQHPVGPFVLDFCCPDRRLAVEIDGGVHDEQRAYDAEREALLEAAGYRVLRFANEAVWSDLAGVLAAIRDAALSQPPRPPQPIPRTAGWE
ncbi:MAG: endonuclease domain-containing protein [Thermomicrobiales bacterium]